MPGIKCSPKTLSQPDAYWAAFQDAADKAGVKLSVWMAEHCLAALPAGVRRKLPERPADHRPKLKK